METIIIVVGVIAVALVAYFVLGVGNPSTPQLGSGGGGTTYDYTTNIIPPSGSGSQSSSAPMFSPSASDLINGANSNSSGYSLRGPTGAVLSGTNGYGINRNGTTTSTVNGQKFLLFNKSQQG